MKKTMVIVLALALLLGCTAYAEPAEANLSTVSVMGEGVVMIESDLATVSLGVSEQSADVLEAQGTVNKKIAAVSEALKELGIDPADISTNYIYLNANYDYSGSAPMITGYTATNDLSVRTTDIENVGKIIDAAFSVGANQLNGVNFSKQDTSQSQSQALTIATQNAMSKAQTLADAVGMKLGTIKSITETYSYASSGSMNVSYAMNEAADGGTNVHAALVSVSASVTIEYELTK